MLGMILEILDATIVNVSLPHMQGSFSASVDEITWIVTSYLVANGIMIPMTGWISSRIGRKRYFLVSVTGFVLASAAAQELLPRGRKDLTRSGRVPLAKIGAGRNEKSTQLRERTICPASRSTFWLLPCSPVQARYRRCLFFRSSDRKLIRFKCGIVGVYKGDFRQVGCDFNFYVSRRYHGSGESQDSGRQRGYRKQYEECDAEGRRLF